MESLRGQRVRRRAAAGARALVAGEVGGDEFFAEFGEVADPQVAELVALIALEPEVGGFSGVRPRQYGSYREAVERLIPALEG